ncbi:MAG TPA: hypothetical protein VFT10_03205 [Solirubrobacterales bacterium]|nr:hypothetical protein [Solirubrobacterales bacterium]
MPFELRLLAAAFDFDFVRAWGFFGLDRLRVDDRFVDARVLA